MGGLSSAGSIMSGHKHDKDSKSKALKELREN